MSVAFAPHRRLLGQYLRPLRSRVLLLSALLVADIALRLVNPQVIRFFIDTAQAGGPVRLLVLAALIYLVAGLTGRCLTLASTYLGLDVGWQATNRLRSDLAAHLLRLDMPFHKTHTPGELIERVDGDVTSLAEFFSEMVVRFFANGLLVVAILLMLYRENATSGVTLTVYTLIVAAALVLVNRIGVRAWAAAREAWAEAFGFLEERLAGLEDIRGIGAESHILSQFQRLLDGLLLKARGGRMANARAVVITNLLYVLGYAGGLAIGATLYLRGEVSIGTAFVIVYYIGMLTSPLEEIREQATRLQESTASVDRVSDLLALTPQVTEKAGAALPAGPLSAALERVTFRYEDAGSDSFSGQPILRDISLSLPAGRKAGVLGRTGSGKTTLARLLFRLYDPQSGKVCIHGADIRELSLDGLRSRVGMVTQDVHLFGATIRDNLTLFDPTISDERIWAALAELDLLDWVSAMPQGLDTHLSSGGKSISAGEAQLLAFARLLLRSPGLVILDEASARLDPVTERRLERALDRLLVASNATALIIAHRLHTVERADDILILDDGRIVEYGERNALARDPGSRFARLLRTGLEEVLQ